MRKISSFALAFAFLMPLAGCPSDDSSDDGSATTTMTPPATGTTDPTAGEESSTPATDDGMTAGTADDSSGGGGGAGSCGLTCEAPEDCAFGGNAADWECNEGFCDYVGTPPACDEALCSAGGGACADVDGVNQCTYPCTEGGTECDFLTWECTGEDDAGNSICQPAPAAPCTEGEACEGGFGVCTNGECVCTTDEECTADGYGCRPAA